MALFSRTERMFNAVGSGKFYPAVGAGSRRSNGRFATRCANRLPLTALGVHTGVNAPWRTSTANVLSPILGRRFLQTQFLLGDIAGQHDARCGGCTRLFPRLRTGVLVIFIELRRIPLRGMRRGSITPPDVGRMNEAAAMLTAYDDFTLRQAQFEQDQHLP